MKKTVRTKAPVRRKTTAQRTKSARSTKAKAVGSSFGAGAIALIVVFCVVGVAMLLAARESSDPGNANVRPSTAVVEPSTAVVESSTPVVEAATPVVEPPAPVKKAATSKTTAAIPSKTAATPAAAKELEAPVKEPEAPPAISSKTATPAAAREPEAQPAGSPAVVAGSMTVAGCLERTDNGFRLKDTSGDAPKSRSWKSGFLKKGSAPITIVGASNGLALADHVGQRVSVTGTLIDREMHAQSLRRVSASCK